MQCVLPLKHYSTNPYYNPDAMVHVLLTLNEPLLQRSRPRGPLGLSLTTNTRHNVHSTRLMRNPSNDPPKDSIFRRRFWLCVMKF